MVVVPILNCLSRRNNEVYVVLSLPRHAPRLSLLPKHNGEFLTVTDFTDNVRSRTNRHLATALHRNDALSTNGIRERFFSFMFRGLVYPQIWEDPVVDMDALSINRNDHVVAIASGGCNVMSYLCANPARITALDLNDAHIALNRLKIAAVQNLPNYSAFRSFFGYANRKENIQLYDRFISPGLDEPSRGYWEGRSLRGTRRISQFSHGFYRHGALGAFIRSAHLIAKLHGVNLRDILKSKSIADQKDFFDKRLAPLVSKPLLRWLAARPESLYGLGIPPAQYRALASDHPGGITEVLRQRIAKLACGFPLSDNYFAWQAFGRGYSEDADAPLPPYLEEPNYERVRANAERIDVRHQSVTDYLRSCRTASVDCVVLLDAQDWMNDSDLNALWLEITRTAQPGARVIFRTAASTSLLPGRVEPHVLERWRRDDLRSDALHLRDRSAIYGAFHLYILQSQQ